VKHVVALLLLTLATFLVIDLVCESPPGD